MRNIQNPFLHFRIPAIALLLIVGILYPVRSYSQSFSSELKSISIPAKLTLINSQFVDIDNDGDLDLIFPYANFPSLITNTGSSEKPSFGKGMTMPFGIKDLGMATFADIDGDGDLDAIGYSYKKMKVGKKVWQVYKNTGTPSNPQYAEPVPLESGINKDFNIIRFVDIDGDKDLDIVGITSSALFFQENTGSNETPQFSASKSEPFGLPETSGVIIDFADIDNDGDLDAYCFGKLNGEKEAKQYIQLNNGDKENPSFSELTPATSLGIDESMENVQFVDIDGDGDLDAVGTVKYRLFYQENTSK